ncbi:hypothetical protein GCM10009799_40670 [Nocardiopsis rhodophaea]|uniref:Uncharacterized protein n=1 Tax=Nocardiopsis rhodophaea TaxID=280238 RepID=A0ABN2TGW2_9ACTN
MVNCVGEDGTHPATGVAHTPVWDIHKQVRSFGSLTDHIGRLSATPVTPEQNTPTPTWDKADPHGTGPAFRTLHPPGLRL